MKTNYQIEMMNIINQIEDSIPSLLLHSCCGPCSTHVISLLTKYFNITVFYYNPNIEPIDEYIKRKEEQKKLLKKIETVNKLDFLDCDYDNKSFTDVSSGLEEAKEGGARCYKCFELRLKKTAKKCKELNYDYFTTTLTVSPHKNSQVINLIGKQVAEVELVKYLPSDFKKEDGYKKSIELAKKYELYRQDYCGCEYSKRDSNIII